MQENRLFTASAVILWLGFGASIAQAQPAGRPSFDRMLQRLDANENGKIDQDEFRGPEQFFSRLDSNGDGTLDKKEFESRRRGGNRMSGKKGSRDGNGSENSSRMQRYEVFPTQKPAPGDVAPEVELHDLQGNRVSLSELLKTKPALIETGSYTCPVFRKRHASIEKLQKELGDPIHLVVLYGKEAHPNDEIKQPGRNEDRLQIAQKAVIDLAIEAPVLADDVNNRVTTAYGGLPNSGILIGQDGRVFHKLSWIHPDLMREPIAALLKSGGSGGANPPSFPVGGNHPSESGEPKNAVPSAASPTMLRRPERKSASTGSDTRQRGRRKLPVPDEVKVRRDREYAQVDEQSLRLDLYVPSDAKTPPPLLMWVHGGGWKNGDKGQINSIMIRLTGEGYAAASINYRLNGLKAHPEHIHDCKAAVRWLRAHAQEYGYDATRIGVGGGSAGGHLALLLGMSAGVPSLEGEIGDHLDQSSRVQAVLDLYGPSNFATFQRDNSRFQSRHQATSEEQLLSASPLNYLTSDDAPVLIFQGDEDTTVPMSQSQLLHERYQAAGLESTLHLIEGAGHGGPKFSDSERYELAKAFFERHLPQ